MVEMALDKALSAIQRVNPDHHLIFVELIRKLIEVLVCLGSRLPIDAFQVLKVISIGHLMQFVVFQQHLLSDMLFVYLVRHNVRLFFWITLIIFIFLPYAQPSFIPIIQLTYDCGSRIQLLQVILNCFLDLDIGCRKYVTRCLTYTTAHSNSNQATYPSEWL